MSQNLQEAVTTVDDLFDDCSVTVNAETDTTVTLSLQLTSDRLTTIVTTLRDTRFSLQTVTYRGASNPSTVTLTTTGTVDETLDTLQTAAEGAYRGETENGHSFTFFGTNNRVEINDFFNKVIRSPFVVTDISATETPPLCIDVTIERPSDLE